jgi:NitT/TauT family transport system substrate-binding protein
MKKILGVAIIFIVLALLLIKIPKKPVEQKLQKVAIMMPFAPSIQWSAYYTAINKGFYENEGLDVNIQYSSKGNIGGVEQLIGGNVDFIHTSEDTLIIARSKGLKIVSLYPIEPNNVFSIVSEKSKNIQKPADLAGKTISVVSIGGSNYTNLLVILHSVNLTKDDVEIIPAGPNYVPAFLEGKFDAVSTHLVQELQIKEELPNLNIIKASDYSDISRQHIAVEENLIKSNPELIKKFLLATKKGLEYAVGHPEDTVEIYNGINPDAKSQKKADLNLWNALIKIYNFKTSLPGEEKSVNWKKSQDVLFDLGLITKKTDVSAMFTNKFIPK